MANSNRRHSVADAGGRLDVGSPEDVFAFLADGTNNTRRKAGVVDIAHSSGTAKGAIYEQGVKGPFGRRVPADYEITAFDPGKRLAFRAIAGPVRPEGAYVLEPIGGNARLTFSLSCWPRGFAKLMSR